MGLNHNTNQELTARLSRGDIQAAAPWLRQTVGVVWTILFYRLNKDIETTQRLTEQVYRLVFERLAEKPADQSAEDWVAGLAVETLQRATVEWGIRPQRPWAWSELPEQILDTLYHIGHRPLPLDVTQAAAVKEIAQAVFNELPSRDRRLLYARYMRLETVERLAAEGGISLEALHEQLYLARHHFRRALLALVQSVRGGFVEPFTTGAAEALETNLEMLLRAIEPSAPMPAEVMVRLEQAVIEMAQHLSEQTAAKAAAVPRSKPIWQRVLAIAGVALLAVVIGVWLWHAPQESVQLPSAKPNLSVEVKPSATDQEQLEQVIQAGRRGDVRALIAALKGGAYMAQVAAAQYLAQIGDASAIEPLLAASQRWFGDQTDNNPFAQAAAEIEKRLTSAAAPAVAQPPKPQPEPAKQTIASLRGRVLSADGQPLSAVALTAAPEAGGAAVATVSDSAGGYQFADLKEGLWLVSARDMRQRVPEMTRLIFIEKDKPRVCDFGGGRVLRGVARVDGAPIADTPVLLCRPCRNPPRGVWTSQTTTDAQGRFVFCGVPDGAFEIYARLAGNRWTFLAAVSDAAQDQPVDAALTTATIQVQPTAAAGGGNGRQMVAVVYSYWFEPADTVARWPAVRGADGKTFEIRGAPLGQGVLTVDFEGGWRCAYPVSIEQTPIQVVSVASPPTGQAAVWGRFSQPSEAAWVLEGRQGQLVLIRPNEQDVFELAGLAAGSYQVGILYKGEFVPLRRLELLDGQRVVLEISPMQWLAERAEAAIYLVDEDGQCRTDFAVLLWGDGGALTLSADERAYAVFAPAGSYELTILGAAGASSKQSITLVAPSAPKQFIIPIR